MEHPHYYRSVDVVHASGLDLAFFRSGALVRAVRQDFGRGRTVQVGGRIPSKTEAELCALSLYSVPASGPV